MHGRIVREQAVQRILARARRLRVVHRESRRRDAAVAQHGGAGRGGEEAPQHVEEVVSRLDGEPALHLRAHAELADLLGARGMREVALLQLALDRADHAALASNAAAPRPRGAHETPHHLEEDRTRQLVGEELGGDVLEVVRLVEDEPPVGREDARAVARRLREHERVVRHHHVGAQGPRARLRDEALPRVAAGASHAVLARTHEPRAQHLRAEVVEVAVLRAVQPFHEILELGLLVLVEREPAALHDFLEGAEAEVVRAALEHGRAEVPRVVAKYLRGAREVLGDQLALEVARVGGEDDGRVVRVAPEDGRHEVGERLAHARARLDHEVLAIVERAHHGAEHVELAGTRLVPFHAAERAARLEVARRGVGVDRRAVLVRGHAALRASRLQVGNEAGPVRVVHE